MKPGHNVALCSQFGKGKDATKSSMPGISTVNSVCFLPFTKGKKPCPSLSSVGTIQLTNDLMRTVTLLFFLVLLLSLIAATLIFLSWILIPFPASSAH